MNLLLISDLNGNRSHYDFLFSQAEQFDVMLWAGSLITPYADNPGEEQRFVERACGQIQARGCRVLARGEREGWACPWAWLKRHGRFIAPGLFVTAMNGDGERGDLAMIREAAWSAGALWIVISRGPVAPGGLVAGAPKHMLLWPNAALRFGPDVIVSSTDDSAGGQGANWLQRRGHTWIFIPGQDGDDDIPSYITFDTVRWTATRHSSAGTERRELTALRRMVSSVSSPSTHAIDIRPRASRDASAHLLATD